MRTVLSILLGLAILGSAAALVGMMVKFKPEAQKIERERVLPGVEVMSAKRSDVPLKIPSQGLVRAMRETSLAAEVSGRVIKVSPRFKVGERFAEGEVLVELEGSDYRSGITQAESALAEAKAALIQEKARAEQAVRDWAKISPGQPPTDLAARKPQMMSVEARVMAAEDALARARRDLERTQIRAPFAGRVRATFTELGSYLAPGGRVADFDSTGLYEIRLPLSLDDLAFLESQHEGQVTLKSTIAGQDVAWQGKVVRTEGEVERASRSVYLVAEIEEDARPENAFLKPGLFLRAEIVGRTVKGVFQIPRRAFLDETRLIVVGEGDKLEIRTTKMLRGGRDTVLVTEGVQEGERICLTSLSAPMNGMAVRVYDAAQGADAPAPKF